MHEFSTGLQLGRIVVKQSQLCGKFVDKPSRHSGVGMMNETESFFDLALTKKTLMLLVMAQYTSYCATALFPLRRFGLVRLQLESFPHPTLPSHSARPQNCDACFGISFKEIYS